MAGIAVLSPGMRARPDLLGDHSPIWANP